MSDPAQRRLAGFATGTPHGCLRDLVTSYHGYRYELDGVTLHRGLPSTSLTVVLAIEQPIDVGWLGDDESRRQRWTCVSGLGVRPAGIYQVGPQHGVMLDLTPAGARSLLGIPASALSADIVSLDDVLGNRGSGLHEAVAAARTWSARFAALDHELLALAASRSDDRAAGSDPTLQHAWNRLHLSGGGLPMTQLAGEVGWSRRQLSQRFAIEYGIGPKQAARLIRFGRARALVASRRCTLADVSLVCGYADQAHLTREWREFAGLPPTSWLREDRPFLQDRTAEI